MRGGGVVIVVVVGAGLLLGAGCVRDSVSEGERERAVAAALQVYERERAAGRDFSAGPCIAEEAIDNWSVDIAHGPRQEIDDQPENQCQFYRDGKTRHFVELDPEGRVIRVR